MAFPWEWGSLPWEWGSFPFPSTLFQFPQLMRYFVPFTCTYLPSGPQSIAPLTYIAHSTYGSYQQRDVWILKCQQPLLWKWDDCVYLATSTNLCATSWQQSADWQYPRDQPRRSCFIPMITGLLHLKSCKIQGLSKPSPPIIPCTSILLHIDYWYLG